MEALLLLQVLSTNSFVDVDFDLSEIQFKVLEKEVPFLLGFWANVFWIC